MKRITKLCMIAIALLMAIGNVKGAEIRSNPVGSAASPASWTSGSTWENNTAPTTSSSQTCTDDVVIAAGAYINLGTTSTVGSITIEPGGTLVLSSALTATNSAIIDGTLIANRAISAVDITCDGIIDFTGLSSSITLSVVNGSGTIIIGTATVTFTTTNTHGFLQANGGTLVYNELSYNLSNTRFPCINNLIINGIAAGGWTINTININGDLTINTTSTDANAVLGGTVAVAGNLTVNTDAVLDFNTRAFSVGGSVLNNGTLTCTTGTLTVNGNVVNNGIQSNTTGKIALGGTAIQSLGGTGTFGTLAINSGATASLTSDVTCTTLTKNGILNCNGYSLMANGVEQCGAPPVPPTISSVSIANNSTVYLLPQGASSMDKTVNITFSNAVKIADASGITINGTAVTNPTVVNNPTVVTNTVISFTTTVEAGSYTVAIAAGAVTDVNDVAFAGNTNVTTFTVEACSDSPVLPYTWDDFNALPCWMTYEGVNATGFGTLNTNYSNANLTCPGTKVIQFNISSGNGNVGYIVLYLPKCGTITAGMAATGGRTFDLFVDGVQKDEKTITSNNCASLTAEVNSNDPVVIKLQSTGNGNSLLYDLEITAPPSVQSTYTWQGSAGSDGNDWNVSSNWNPAGTPSSSDIVIIPGGVSNFPKLSSDVYAAEVHFAPGAQIGGQSHLKAKAFVQYDLSNRGRWNMLSMPLQEAFPGDFTFGGYPLTWIRTFEPEDGVESSATKGNWVTARGGSKGAFSAGDGFVLWLNEDDPSLTDVSTKGLNSLNQNILELPCFFKLDGTNVLDLAQTYDSGTGKSTFSNFELTGNEYDLTSDTYSVDRTDVAYQLAGASVDKTLNFLENTEAGGNVALVGNPYMASLDFDALSSANDGVIKPSYQVWTGNGYSVYTTNGDAGNTTAGMTNLIAPLQGFLVEAPDSPSSSSLNFTETMAATEATTLRSSANIGDKLDIVARNSVGGVLTFIAKREGGQDSFGDLDARKIINDLSGLPEVYTLKPYKGKTIGAAVNIINNDDVVIPIGLATSYTGNITLSFSGMDSYNAKISLIDAQTNKEIDLTGLASYDYDVNYTPKTMDGSVVASEDRFFIRISKAMTGLPETLAETVKVFEGNGGLIQVISSASDPIKEVAVYDLQGALKYKESAIHATSHTINKHWPAGVYIVKVISENTINNVKLIIQ